MCPLCLYFLEESQFYPELENEFPDKIPIIHINKLLGIMLGNEEIPNILKKSHKISLDPLMEKILVK